MFINEVVYSLITLLITLSFNYFTKMIYMKIFKKKLSPRNNTIFLLVLNMVRYSVLIVSILIIANIFNVDMATLVAGAGFLGLLIGLGMQKLLQDMINGFFIIFENHYIVGEYVMINNVTGEVLEIGLKTTSLKTYEGELYLFSNGSIEHIVNYSRFPSLSLVDIHIPYKYAPYEILEIIKEIVSKYNNTLLVSEVEVLGVQKVDVNFYDIRISCYTKSYEHFGITRQIRVYVLQKLKEKGIDINLEKIIDIKI